MKILTKHVYNSAVTMFINRLLGFNIPIRLSTFTRLGLGWGGVRFTKDSIKSVEIHNYHDSIELKIIIFVGKVRFFDGSGKEFYLDGFNHKEFEIRLEEGGRGSYLKFRVGDNFMVVREKGLSIPALLNKSFVSICGALVRYFRKLLQDNEERLIFKH